MNKILDAGLEQLKKAQQPKVQKSIEPEGKKALKFYMSDADHAALKALTASLRVSMQAFLEEALNAHLAKIGKKPLGELGNG